MTASLIAISGPLRNSTFDIDEELAIGREPTNQVCLRTPAASRQHCVIRRDGPRHILLDLQSRNGTFINEVPVTEHVLAHGDRIAVPGSVFVFSAGELLRPDLEPLTLVESDALLPTVTVCDRDPLRVDASVAPSDLLRQARVLEHIVEISNVLAARRDPDALQRELLTRILELTAADCAAVLLYNDINDPPSSILGLHRGGMHVQTVQLSREVIGRVLQERIGILIERAGGDAAHSTMDALVRIGCCSMVAVPLIARDRILAILYLDTRDAERRLDNRDLEIATAVAAVAGPALDSALHFERLRRQADLLRSHADRDTNLIGGAPAMQAVYRMIDKVAASDATVLVLGESGTGKELAARAIHRKSARAEKPFVALNCATFGENLLESELFGHEKGAFTGAIAAKRGQLEMADGGTLFLDEIGELPMAVQVKLLRVLQEREFVRVGGMRPIRINVRVVAATNRDLRAAIAAGTFRSDLWHRVNVVAVAMPPLRARPDDLGLLANYFIAKFSKKCGRVVTGLSAPAKRLLLQYSWPGNVRELENAIERAIVLGEDEEIQPHDLPEGLSETAASSGAPEAAASYESALNTLKQKLVIDAVEATRGNYTEAARRLDIHPTHLHRLIRNFNLRPTLEKLLT
jgi:two-component system, NtrC family, response regulator HydG